MKTWQKFENLRHVFAFSVSIFGFLGLLILRLSPPKSEKFSFQIDWKSYEKFMDILSFETVQRFVNLVDLEECCRTTVYLQTSVSIQPRRSPPKIITKDCTQYTQTGWIPYLAPSSIFRGAGGAGQVGAFPGSCACHRRKHCRAPPAEKRVCAAVQVPFEQHAGCSVQRPSWSLLLAGCPWRRLYSGGIGKHAGHRHGARSLEAATSVRSLVFLRYVLLRTQSFRSG